MSTNFIGIPKPVRTYETWVPRWNGFPKQTYTRRTAGQARKAAYDDFLEAGYNTVKFTDIRVRSLRSVVVSAEVMRIAAYRDVPFVYNGMPCKLGGQLGRIVGAGGGGCWFQFLTDDRYGSILWFHPQGDPVIWLKEDGYPLELPVAGGVA